MQKKEIKYIYLSNLEFDGTVFITQILDWLHLFESKNIKFDLYVAYSVKKYFNRSYLNNQSSKIRGKTELFKGFTFLFPSRLYFQYINAIILLFTVLIDILKFKKVLIFSRAIIGKELQILKKMFPNKIYFIYDARAASAEENLYNFRKDRNYSSRKFEILAHVFQTESKTVEVADKIFAVSEILIKYIIKTYAIDKNKFFLYPCLGDSNKFFYDDIIRSKFRDKLNYLETDIVLLYAGGVNSKWHLSKFIFEFFDQVSKSNKSFKFLFLSADLESIEQTLNDIPFLKTKCKFLKVPNEDVVNYLNAADFGILFRENTVMNNVASPTKFAEYILCGLPTIITEDVGDYSKFLVENNLGVLLEQFKMDDLSCFDSNILNKNSFDRNRISQIGIDKLSKFSRIEEIIKIFNLNDTIN